MSTSHYSSRPAQTDVGSNTIRIPLSRQKLTKQQEALAAQIWMAVGVLLLIADGTAMWHFADSALEATIIALLSMPTGILVIVAALKFQDKE